VKLRKRDFVFSILNLGSIINLGLVVLLVIWHFKNSVSVFEVKLLFLQLFIDILIIIVSIFYLLISFKKNEKKDNVKLVFVYLILSIVFMVASMFFIAVSLSI